MPGLPIPPKGNEKLLFQRVSAWDKARALLQRSRLHPEQLAPAVQPPELTLPLAVTAGREHTACHLRCAQPVSHSRRPRGTRQGGRHLPARRAPLTRPTVRPRAPNGSPAGSGPPVRGELPRREPLRRGRPAGQEGPHSPHEPVHGWVPPRREAPAAADSSLTVRSWGPLPPLRGPGSSLPRGLPPPLPGSGWAVRAGRPPGCAGSPPQPDTRALGRPEVNTRRWRPPAANPEAAPRLPPAATRSTLGNAVRARPLAAAGMAGPGAPGFLRG